MSILLIRNLRIQTGKKMINIMLHNFWSKFSLISTQSSLPVIFLLHSLPITFLKDLTMCHSPTPPPPHNLMISIVIKEKSKLTVQSHLWSDLSFIIQDVSSIIFSCILCYSSIKLLATSWTFLFYVSDRIARWNTGYLVKLEFQINIITCEYL